MKTEIENIALIEKYLKKELTFSEVQSFEERLQSDKDFWQLFDDQKSLIKGIERTGLNEDIAAAKQQYVQAKWLKTLGISLASVAVIALIWATFFNNDDSERKIIQNDVEKPVHVAEEAISPESDVVFQQSEPIDSLPSNSAETKRLVSTRKQDANQPPDNHYDKPIVTVSDSIEILDFKVGAKDKYSSLNPLFELVKKKPQSLEVNAEEGGEFKFDEGTLITIPKHAFVDAETRNLVHGNVLLEVTEYYKLSDILLGNLSTTSNSQPLETGGMLYIQATKNGKKLEKIKPISIGFPFKKKKPDMQLFSGKMNDDGVNWIPEGNRTQAVLSIDSIEENVEVDFSVVESVPIYPGCEKLKINSELKACFDEKIKEFVSLNFNTNIAQDLGLTGKNVINAFFKIDADGSITNINVRASSVTLGEEAIRVIQSLPRFEPALQRGKPVIVPYYLPLVFDLPGRDKNLPMVSVGLTTSEEDLDIPRDSVKSHQATFNAYRASNYVFSNAKLGWVNCDRFVRDWNNKIKYKFKVKNAEGANIKMVFKSLSAILPGKATESNVDFGLVPKDEEIVLVAIKKVDDTFYLGVKETQIEEISELEFDFKPVTIEELKNEIIKLNEAFKI